MSALAQRTPPPSDSDGETERLRRELAAAEERLRLHQQQTPVAVVETDLDGVIQMWNPAAERIFGWTAEEATGRVITEILVPPGEIDAVLRLYSRLRADRQPASRVNDNLTMAGQRITCEWHNTPLVDARGDVVGFASLALDVTERVRAIAALRDSEERYALAVRGTSDGIWDRDLLTEEVRHNERFWTMLGYSRDDIARRDLLNSSHGDWRETVHPDDWAGIERAEADHLAGRTPAYEASFRMRRKDGSWMWILSRAKALRDSEGRPYRMVGAHTDIDQRIRLEEELRQATRDAQAASRAKSQFLATMSHELRTPLNAIIGFAEIIEAEVLGPVGNDVYQEYGRNVRESGHHLLAIINDVLDMSKIEAGKLEIEPEALQARKVARAALMLVRGLAQSNEVTLEVSIPQEPLPIYGDELAIKQIIVNLLSNALKFTPAGGRARLIVEPQEDGATRIAVSDTGAGMTEQQLKVAMEPFGQLQNAMTRDQPGTGLGLPIVHGLVELHHGRLEIDSTLDAGTTVSVWLPGPTEEDLAEMAAAE